MEITATGPLAIGTASTGNSGGDSAGGAFASVLGAFGATTAPAAPATGTPVVQTPNANMPLIVSAAAVAAPAQVMADTPLPQSSAPATGEGLPALPTANAPAAAEVKAPAAEAKPASDPKTMVAPAGPVVPQAAGDAEAPAPAEAATAEAAPETLEQAAELPLQPEQPPEIKGEAAVEMPALPTSAAPVPPPQQRQQAPVQQPQPQTAEKDFEAAKGAARGGKAQEQGVQAEAAVFVAQPSETPVETLAEPFAKMVPAAAPERGQPQPQPQPQVQPQANAAPLPSVPIVQPQAQLAAEPVVQAARHEAHPTVSFRSDKMAEEMGLEIARRVSAGGDELVIRMDPAELGRINIRMAVNEQGQLRAIVSADAPAVLEALRSDVSELSRALEQAGVRTDSQSFRFDRGGSGDPGSQWQQRYQQQNASTRQGEGNAFAATADEPAYRPMATNGRVNVMA